MSTHRPAAKSPAISRTRQDMSAASAPKPSDAPPEPAPAAPGLTRFDIAVARAQARYTAEQWALLEPSTRTATIYAELRHLDAIGGSARLAAE